MKKHFCTISLFLISCALIAQQDTSTISTNKDKKPVRAQWQGSMLIDNPTTLFLPKKNFEFVLHHRFSDINDGIKNLFGLYGASNIRIGLNYSLTDGIVIGFGTEKDRKYQELFAKIKILQQTRDNKMPVSVAFYGNACISARGKEYWGSHYKFIDKLSYFSQLLIARKFSDGFSLQSSLSFSHINKVDSKIFEREVNDTLYYEYKSLYSNQAIGLSLGGRLKIYKSIGLLFEFDHGINIAREEQELISKPNIAFGAEIKTLTHLFHIFISSYRGIIPQHNYTMNQFDATQLIGLMPGFNMVVKF